MSGFGWDYGLRACMKTHVYTQHPEVIALELENHQLLVVFYAGAECAHRQNLRPCEIVQQLEQLMAERFAWCHLAQMIERFAQMRGARQACSA